MTQPEPTVSQSSSSKVERFVVLDDGRGDEPFYVVELAENGDVVDTLPERFADSKEAENYRSTVAKEAS